MRRIAAYIASAALGGALLGAGPALAQYTVAASYPAPGPAELRLYLGLNNLGQVASERIDLSGSEIEYYGLVFGPDGGGPLPMGNPYGVHCTFASAINDAGRIAGAAFDATEQAYAVYWDTASGRGAPLGGLGGLSYATAINASGVMVGMYGFDIVTGAGGSGASRAFITDAEGRQMRDLGLAGSMALAVNGRGQVLVSADRLYLTGDDGHDPLALGDAAMGLEGQALNDAGQVVGAGLLGPPGPASSRHAFVTGPGGSGFVDLGALLPGAGSSIARSINGRGEVVGQFTLDDGPHAFFVASDHAALIDLNTQVSLPEGQRLTDVVAINERGQILALSADGGALLLTPVSEPASAALLALGLLALRRRRARA